MRITSIELTNFRCFAGAVVDLPTRVTFLVGRNHGGKSSVIDGLRWNLVGSCRGTAADGKGSDILIRDGAEGSAMKVAVGIDPFDGPSKPFTVERLQNARTSTFAIAGVTGTRQATEAALADRLGASPAVLAACLDSSAFLDLHHAEAKRVLMEVLDVTVEIAGERVSLAEMDGRYQHWYRERPARKKALDAVRLPAKPEDGTPPDVTALESKLTALRDEEKRLIASEAQDSGRRQEIERQIESARKDQTRLQSKLIGLETVKGADLEDAFDEIVEAIAKSALTEGETAEAEQARVSLVDAEGRLKLLTDTIAAVKTHQPERGCVLNAAIECRTPAKEFKAELKTLQQGIDEIREQQNTATQLLERVRLRAADQTDRERKLELLRQQQRDRDSVRGDIDTLNQTLTRLLFERDDIPTAAAGPSAALVELRARIEKGERVVRDVRQDIQARAAYEEAKKAQTEAARALGEAERNVELYGPTGARVKALDAALDTFHARINAALDRFGYRLRLIADPWQVLVNDRPAALLSESERLQAGIALQLAIAEISGVGVVAIDRVDLFDAENRRAFGALLDATPVQVIAAATKDDSFEPPAIEDWTWLRITQVNGASTVQPCGEAVLA